MKGNARTRLIRSQATKYPDASDNELEKLVATYKRRYRGWNEKDSETVRRYYLRVPLQKLAEHLNRSPSSVQDEAQKLRSRGIKLECDK